MNYIQQLEQERTDLQDLINVRAERVQELLEYLSSTKFYHNPADNSRTDWVSVADVQRWLRYIEEPVE